MAQTNKPLDDGYALSIYQALRRLQQAAEVHAKRLSRYGGLTPLQLLILQTLAVQNELTASQLARCVSLSAATLSGVLERLEGRGLVSRTRDEQDRRRHWLRLEPAGRAVLDEAPSLLPVHVMERFAGLEEWQRYAVLAGLLRAADLFEAPDEEEG
ncbi:MAG TPA: MarR family transcriptional regulator [Pseudomonas sp.]|nr:MarR family transcriptional regulator [Pseudomonas sp.]